MVRKFSVKRAGLAAACTPITLRAFKELPVFRRNDPLDAAVSLTTLLKNMNRILSNHIVDSEYGEVVNVRLTN